MKKYKRIVNPKKLLNSKWSVVTPTNKEKHFIVTKLVTPDQPDQAITLIQIEAIYTKRSQTIPWQQLNDASVWLQGWVN
jgi:tryptophan-rich hypothetical protein